MNNKILEKLKNKQIPAESGIFLAWVLLILTFSILSPYFFTTQNFSNILIQSAITIVIASGATIVIALWWDRSFSWVGVVLIRDSYGNGH